MATLTFSMPRLTQFLIELLHIPSPTGYYHEAIDYTQQAFAKLDLPDFTLAQTTKGALLMTWRGQHNTAPRGLTAHVDTLGFMVKEIKPNGALKVTNLGGILWHGAEFENVTVRTHANQRYRGTLIPVNPSTHVNPNIVTQPRDSDNMEVRLDLKTSNAEQTRAFGIEVGDFVFVDPRVEVIDTGFIRSRFLDNKAGVAVIYEALIALKEANLRPVQDTHILIANYEEVGHGGSAGFPDGLAELLAIDMAALGHGQNSDEFHVTICIKDSSGPYHFEMNNKLRALATAHNIPHKTDIYPFYSSDGSAYWRAGGTGKVGLIGPGVASSHSYERTHVDTLEHSTHLIARYLLSE